jgi:hypothetical protein
VKRRRPRLQTREIRWDKASITKEVEYISARAMAEDARVVALPPLVFFSTTTGDAWILDAEDNLALQIAAAKTKLPVTITETPERFAIEWPGTFRIEGDALIFAEKTGRARTIIGYPTEHIMEALTRARA